MRKLGMITDIEKDNITLTIWDTINNKIKEIKITEFDKTVNYFISQFIEYQEENNRIIQLTSIDYSKEEQKELFEIFKETITNPKVSLAFYEQLDLLEGREPKKNIHR